jgi:DNA-directed RNA polymerase specialized sigma subunit
MDSTRAVSLLPNLPEAEQLVIEFYFGLNGLKAIKERAIAAKLGRTEPWVNQKLRSGLVKLRAEL